MSSWARWACGLVLGSILAFFVFQPTRLLLLDGLQWGPSQIRRESKALVENVPKLPLPTDSLTRWQWLETAARKRSREGKLSPATRQELIELSREGAKAEPENSYWLQLEAVWSRDADRWVEASRRPRWADPQELAMQRLELELRRPFGPRAWHYGALRASRSDSILLQLEGLSREYSRTRRLDAAGITVRRATLRNGDLIRLGARSLPAASTGSKITEIATFPPEVLEFRSPRKLILARIEFVEALQARGGATEAELADRSFSTNDSWMALLESSSVADSTRDTLLRALVASGIPACLLVMLLGWSAGWAGWYALERRQINRFRPVLLAVVAMAAAFATFLATGQSLASLVVVLCLSLLGWSPKPARSEPVLDFGPFYRFAVFSFALTLNVLIACFLLGISTPGWELARVLPIPEDYYGFSPLFLGLSMLVVGLGLLLAPALAMAYRIRTPLVVFKLLTDLHRTGTIVTLSLFLLAVPLGVLMEQRTREELRRIFQNETLYYLSQ
jgi:hypothetical protein